MFLKQLVTLILLVLVSCQVNAGIILTSTRAIAGTNAFAPLDRSMYFDEHAVESVSPLSVSASGDWTGPNVGGGPDTWHWVGAAQSKVTTNVSSNALSISGSGSFSIDLTTTADFVNPNLSTVIYGPGSYTEFVGVFSIDQLATFTLGATLSKYSLLTLYSLSASNSIYSKINNNQTPFVVNQNGILPAGQYELTINTNYGGATNLGASHEVRTGSFTNFNFTVSVPEPSLLGAFGFAGLFLRRRR